MKYELTRSIIYNCPAIKCPPASFGEELARVQRLIILKGASVEDAKLILHALNLMHYNASFIALLREAADVIARIPEDIANKMQVRHWLPDELEGSAIIIEGETEATNAQKNDSRSG